jgi:hypothetical protein
VTAMVLARILTLVSNLIPLANSYGSMAPLLILIGLKTLVDLGTSKPLGGGHARIEFKS